MRPAARLLPLAALLAVPAALAIDPAAATPPTAKKVPHRSEVHGTVCTDDYFWIKDKKNPEVIKYLEKAMGQPIIVPQAVLAEVQVTSETPVKLKTDRVSMRTVLKKLLAEVNLAYVIKDQTIQVMTTRGAAETMSTRTYYVGDLVTVVDLRFGPVAIARQSPRR